MTKLQIIKKAIKESLLLEIYYRGDKTVKAGDRLIWIQCYGRMRGGRMGIRAYIVRGVSKSNHRPLWRLFRLDRIKAYGLLTDQRKQLRNPPPLSKKGDKGFTQIITQNPRS